MPKTMEMKGMKRSQKYRLDDHVHLITEKDIYAGLHD